MPWYLSWHINKYQNFRAAELRAVAQMEAAGGEIEIAPAESLLTRVAHDLEDGPSAATMRKRCAPVCALASAASAMTHALADCINILKETLHTTTT